MADEYDDLMFPGGDGYEPSPMTPRVNSIAIRRGATPDYRAAALQQRQQQDEWRQRMDMLTTEFNVLKEQREQAKFEADIQKARAETEMDSERLRQAANIYAQTAKFDPRAENARSFLASVQANNVMGIGAPGVKEHLDTLRTMVDDVLAQQTEAQKIADARTRAEKAGMKFASVAVGDERYEAPKPPEKPTPAPTRGERLKEVSEEMEAEFGVSFADVRQRGQRGFIRNGDFVADTKGDVVRTPLKDGGLKQGFVDIPIDRALELEKRVETGAPAAAPEPSSTKSVDTEPAPATVAPVPSISSQEDYDALPSGAEFVWNGRRGRKP